MADETNGYVRRQELERALDRIESRLKVHIADVRQDVKEVDQKAEKAWTMVSRASWMIGGGTGLLVGLWAIYNVAAQLWGLISKAN